MPRSGANPDAVIPVDAEAIMPGQKAANKTPPIGSSSPARTGSHFEPHCVLMDNQLPDAKASKLIAGYLYFPRPKGIEKSDAFEPNIIAARNR